jgi:hypothetical protein
MPQTPSILGQSLPEPLIDTILFGVSIGNQVQFSIFVANQSPIMDKITISLMQDGAPETAANFIAYNTPVLGNSVLAFSGLFMNEGDRVQVKSEIGTTSFTATGMLYT